MTYAPGTLVYPGPGVLTQADGSGAPEAISLASRPTDDTLVAETSDGQEDSYTIDPDTLQLMNAGIVNFTDNSGTDYTIRPLDETDGQWLSRYHTNVPVSALRGMISGQQGIGLGNMSNLLQDQRETMVTFQFPDDDYLFGLLYINQFGIYILTDGSWVMVPPDDDTFDDTYPYYVNPDTVDDFLNAWAQGPVTVANAESQGWITNTSEGRPTPSDDSSDPETDGFEAPEDDGNDDESDTTDSSDNTESDDQEETE